MSTSTKSGGASAHPEFSGESPANTPKLAKRLSLLGESRLRSARSKAGLSQALIDLSSGSPESETPDALKQRAMEAITAGINQYAHKDGDIELRRVIASRMINAGSQDIDPEKMITIASGASSALALTSLALLEPGTEAIVLSPYYEGALQAIRIAGAREKLVPMRFENGHWSLDLKKLRKAFNRRTRAVLLNTPHNPTGIICSTNEFLALTELCREFGATLVSDEIYGELVYGRPGFASAFSKGLPVDNTIVIGGLSKAHNITGWRIGHVIACQRYTDALRRIQSALGTAAPAPLQAAAALALQDPSMTRESQRARDELETNRNVLSEALAKAGLEHEVPHGGTFIFARANHLGGSTDEECRDILTERTGIVATPGSWFFEKEQRSRWLRFCFARKPETIALAVQALSQL